MPQLSDNMLSSQHCLARALYDNVADSPDELAFRKGDTLIVLEQNTNNIEGWWLCTLKGRQGICPANRLRLIPGVYEDTGQTMRVCSPQFTEISGDFSCLQRQGKRRSWHVQPNQVVTPRKFNDVYLYDQPPSRCSPVQPTPRDTPTDFYDVPPRAIPLTDLRPCARCSPISPTPETYDIPRSLTSQPPLTPSSSASSLTTADSFSSSNRSSFTNMPDYDVPRPARSTLAPLTAAHYDVPPTPRELPLELGSALETLERLQGDTAGSISKLLGFVGPRWRRRDRLEHNLMEIKLAVTRLSEALHDLADFGEGALGNAARASDKNLAGKLAPLVAALKRSDGLVAEALERLNEQRWALDALCRTEEEEKNRKPDELEQLVACSRALTEDTRQIASFIQGNSLLLFKRDPQTQNNNNNNPDDALEEYDYVSLETKDSMSKKHSEIRNALPQELKKGFDNLVKHSDDAAFDPEITTTTTITSQTGKTDDDRQVLLFFAAQLITHHRNLTQAIDAFLQTVEHNQPPKVFLAHGKFVVLSAHKLVHIGDTVHRNVSCKQVKERALNCANVLSDALATSVTKTKQAALQFPSVTAVQEMVDSIVDISYSARDLKVCLVQAATPM